MYINEGALEAVPLFTILLIGFFVGVFYASFCIHKRMKNGLKHDLEFYKRKGGK